MDILSFLKADQDERAKEKKKEKELRVQERKEDVEHIVAMIHRGVQTAIQPLEERLESQEKVNQELYKKLDLMNQEVNLLKEKLGNQPYFPALPEPASQQDYQSGRGLWGEQLAVKVWTV